MSLNLKSMLLSYVCALGAESVFGSSRTQTIDEKRCFLGVLKSVWADSKEYVIFVPRNLQFGGSF